MREKKFLLIQLLLKLLKFIVRKRNEKKTKTFERTLSELFNKKS